MITEISPQHILSFYDKPHPLSSKSDRDRVREALKRVTSLDLLLAEEAKGVVYFEGTTDFDLLKAEPASKTLLPQLLLKAGIDLGKGEYFLIAEEMRKEELPPDGQGPQTPQNPLMPNLLEVTYGRTSQSTNTDALGMREMQARVYAQRDAQYLLVKAQKLELILHKFFATVCLEVDVFDRNGKRHTPREWFIAPLVVIEEAIRLTLTGEIIDYTFDTGTNLIRKK